MKSPDARLREALKTRRDKVLSRLEEDAILLPGASLLTKNADVDHPFRQDSDLLYLTYFPEPDTLLLLEKNGNMTLFVPPRDQAKEVWEGKRFGTEGAVEHFDANESRSNMHIDQVLNEKIYGKTVRFLVPDFETKFSKDCLEFAEKAAKEIILDHREQLHHDRLIKDEVEKDNMRRAGEISSRAHAAAMKAGPTSKNEYEVEADYLYSCHKEGARDQAYSPIFAGGVNATCLHYGTNNANFSENSFILIDAGCSWEGYAADITRTWPLNGKFEGEFEQVYDAVLDIQKACIAAVKPGVAMSEMQQLCYKLSAEKLIEMGILKGSIEEALENKSFQPFTLHSLGHHLGLDVHDSSRLTRENRKSMVLEEGMVITVEPGLYFQVDDENVDAKWRGIGVRIEDDILVTADGFENLSASCPREKSEIEAIIRA